MDGLLAGNSPDSDMETRIGEIFSPLFDDDEETQTFPETMVEEIVQNISKELLVHEAEESIPPESMVVGGEDDDDYYEEWIANILSNFTEEQFAKWVQECEDFLGYKN